MSETNKPRYFSYDPDSCFDAHESADDARKCAEETVAYYRDNAGDGWSEHVENVCWGVILSEVEETERCPRTDEDGCNPECDFVVDYDLTEAQDPFAELATLRAKVAELTAQRDAALTRASDLMATNGRLRQQIESFRDQVAGDCL